MKPIVVELQDVKKDYFLGDVVVNVLKGISIKVREGDFFSIMGPSGSGKSTIMNMIGCLDYPTHGKVLLKGQDIRRMSESHLAELRGKTIGFVFQTFNLIPIESAIENVMLPMTFQGKNRTERLSRAKELLSSVGLSHRIEHKPSELSGGERQRVAIARALANNPDIILADEPTGNLDSKTGEEIMNILVKLHEEQGKTIILVTHDNYVAKHADKIIRLLDGRVIR